MTEDISPEIIKKTQDTLGKFIKKPVLTEKLLRKPPFRFLHDICTAAMKDTGFFEGILTVVEIKAENIKDKEGKISFLQKVISAVESANGIKLSVKPSKIVAGHEAIKTNEFLQALAKALEKQFDGGKNTTQVKNLKNRSQKNATKEDGEIKKKTTSKTKNEEHVQNGVEEPKGKKKLSTDTKDTKPRRLKTKPDEEHNSISPNKGEQKARSKHTIKTDPGVVNGNLENGLHDHIEERVERKRTGHKKKSNEGGEEEGKGERKTSGIVRQGAGDEMLSNNVELNGVSLNGEEQRVLIESETKRPASARAGHRRPSATSSGAERSKPVETGHEVVQVGAERTRPESVLGEVVRSPAPPVLASNPVKKEVVAPSDGSMVPRPRTAIRPHTSRPASARPAAPRIRDRGEVQVQEEVVKPAVGKVNVIEDTEAANDVDEEDNLVSLEVNNDVLLDDVPLPEEHTLEPAQGEHGHLVKQILDAKKELEDESKLASTRQTFQGKLEIEWESGRNRESTTREVETLRGSIQTLTRSANPLGKLLDFLQEDVDTMHRELDSWKDMNTNLAAQIAQEETVTEQCMEPLKIHLKELQRNIEQQREQCWVLKANIIRNDDKIQRLLVGG